MRFFSIRKRVFVAGTGVRGNSNRFFSIRLPPGRMGATGSRLGPCRHGSHLSKSGPKYSRSLPECQQNSEGDVNSIGSSAGAGTRAKTPHSKNSGDEWGVGVIVGTKFSQTRTLRDACKEIRHPAFVVKTCCHLKALTRCDMLAAIQMGNVPSVPDFRPPISVPDFRVPDFRPRFPVSTRRKPYPHISSRPTELPWERPTGPGEYLIT